MSKSRDIADSAATINYIDNVTSDVQSQINTLDTALDNISVTSGTLTKTFAQDESASISLTSSVLAPVVSVTKEVPQSGVTNNSWDVNSTTENYTRLDSAYATTLNFENSLIANSSFVNSFTLATTNATATTLSPDGTKMYIIDASSDTVRQYSLSTPYSVSTASYDSVDFSVATEQGQPYGIAFNNDGTKMFVSGFSPARASEYSLSTAWDVSSASFSANLALSGTITGMDVSADGTKMYFSAYTSVLEYSLSTAFDITTASLSYTLGSMNGIYGVAFDSYGTKMYVSDDALNRVRQYNLSTAWSLSTASSVSAFSLSNEMANIRAMYASSQGGFYVVEDNTTDKVFQYAIPQNLQLGTGSFASADVGKTIEANSGAFVLTATDGSYVETTAPTSYDQVASGSWSMYGVVYNATDGDLELSSTIENKYDVSTASYSQSFSVLAQDNAVQDLTFNANGTKLYIVGNSANAVYQYELTTAFDVSTASYLQSFSVTSQEGTPTGIVFNTDGTKMFVCGATGDAVWEYVLSTGFDISTASYSQSFSVATQDTSPQGLAFNSNGTKMFVLGAAGDDVNEYTLSTGFDVSTASYSQNFSVATQDAVPLGIAFNSSGTKMFIVGNANDSVYEYTLSTGFDVSTASYSQSFSITQDTAPNGITFNTDGTKMFVSGETNKNIYEYNIGTSLAPTGYHPVHTTTSIDTRYWTDINSMTADQNAGDGNVYYAISTDDRTTWTVIDNTDGERDIVRNNGGTWQYNSNGTYALETWVNGTTNTELATLAEAMEGANAGSNFRLVVGTDSGNASDFEMNTAGFTDIIDLPNQGTPDLNVFATRTDTVAENTSVSMATNNANAKPVVVVFNITSSSYLQASSISTSTVSLTGITTGSLLLYVSSSVDHSTSINAPSGFTEIAQAANDQDRIAVFYKVADSSSESIANVGDLDYLIEFSSGAINGSGTYIASGTESTSTFNLATDTVSGYPNQMDKTQLDAVTDPNHIALGNDLDLAIVFNMTSGTTVPSSDGVAINYDANVLNKGAVLGTDYDFDAPTQNSVRITALAANNLKVRVV